MVVFLHVKTQLFSHSANFKRVLTLASGRIQLHYPRDAHLNIPKNTHTLLCDIQHWLNSWIVTQAILVLTWTSKQKSPQGAPLCIKGNLR